MTTFKAPFNVTQAYDDGSGLNESFSVSSDGSVRLAQGVTVSGNITTYGQFKHVNGSSESFPRLGQQVTLTQAGASATSVLPVNYHNVRVELYNTVAVSGNVVVTVGNDADATHFGTFPGVSAAGVYLLENGTVSALALAGASGAGSNIIARCSSADAGFDGRVSITYERH